MRFSSLVQSCSIVHLWIGFKYTSFLYGIWVSTQEKEDNEAYVFSYKLNTPLAWIRSYVLGYVENPSHLEKEEKKHRYWDSKEHKSLNFI